MTAKRNILIALMLLLLVAASACALAACNNTTAEISGVQIATDDNGDPMYGGGSYVMPEGMAFIDSRRDEYFRHPDGELRAGRHEQ